MIKIYCDMCGKDMTKEADYYEGALTRKAPRTPPVALDKFVVCPHCKEVLMEQVMKAGDDK